MDSNTKKTLQNKRFRVVRRTSERMQKIHDPMEEVRRHTKMAGEHAVETEPIPPSFYQPERMPQVSINRPWYKSMYYGVIGVPKSVWRNVSNGAVFGYTVVSGSMVSAYEAVVNFFIDLYKTIVNYSVSLWTTISDFFVMMWRGIFGFPEEEDTFTSPLVA
jgi:hypothetical protein